MDTSRSFSEDASSPQFASLWIRLIEEHIVTEDDLQQMLPIFDEVETLKQIAEKIQEGPLEERKKFRRCIEQTGYEDILIWLFNEDYDANKVAKPNLLEKPETEDKLKVKGDLVVKVKPANTYISASDDVYKMGSNPKGYAIIINNRDFSIHKERKGSEMDYQNLQDLFEALGFEVEPHENLTADEMWNILIKFSEKFAKNPCVDCAVIAIGSHGSGNQNVYGTDDDYLSLDDIYSLFNNYYCPALAKKPKLFLIQACRGDVRDEGTDVVDSKSIEASPELDSRLRSDNLETRLPSWSDMAIIHSTIPGYISNRFVSLGSWFVRSFVKVFMEHSCDMHLVDMLRLVNKEMMKLHTFDGEKQSSELILRGWTKNLYFNPGLTEEDHLKQSQEEILRD